jgi:hypothetical protein
MSVVREGLNPEEKIDRAKELIEKKRKQKEEDEERVRKFTLHSQMKMW